MAKTTKSIKVALTGSIIVEPVDSPEPATLEEAKVATAAGVDLGYTTEDGVSFTFGKETEDLKGWNATGILRRLVTETSVVVSFALRQADRETFTTALGGTVEILEAATETKRGLARWTPDLEEQVERRLQVSMKDGADEMAVILRRAAQTAEVEFSFSKTDSINLPLEFTALEADGGAKPVYVLTNEDTFTA